MENPSDLSGWHSYPLEARSSAGNATPISRPVSSEHTNLHSFFNIHLTFADHVHQLNAGLYCMGNFAVVQGTGAAIRPEYMCRSHLKAGW